MRTGARGAREIATVRVTSRLLCVLALALMLAGCDKCGNWFFGLQAPYDLGACKNKLPDEK